MGTTSPSIAFLPVIPLSRVPASHESSLCPAFSRTATTVPFRFAVYASNPSPPSAENEDKTNSIEAMDTSSKSSDGQSQNKPSEYSSSSQVNVNRTDTGLKSAQVASRDDDLVLEDDSAASKTSESTQEDSGTISDVLPISVPIDDMEEGPLTDTNASSRYHPEKTNQESSTENEPDSLQPEIPDQKEPELNNRTSSESNQPPTPQNSVKLNLSEEQKKKAQEARVAAEAAAKDSSSKRSEQNKKLRDNVSRLFTTLGDKTRAFELGRKTRDRAETLVESTIAKGAEENSTQQQKVKASAASAAKSLVATITAQWQEKLMPAVRKQLPGEFADISSNTAASVAVGAFVAILFLPSLFHNGNQPKQAEIKKLEAQTSALEKKLERESKNRTQSSMQKSVFPPEDKVPKSPSEATSKLSQLTKPSPKPSPVTPPPASQQTPPTPIKPAASPQPPKAKEDVLELKDITPEMTLSVITKKLGTNGNFIISASFDSFYAEPTVALQVRKTYHTLSAKEQRHIAELALQAARSLGYERVTFVEEETGRQVAQAGLDIDLEDETENLRAEVASMRKMSDDLAIKSARDATEINSLKSRLEEERERFSSKVGELERGVDALRKENRSLSDDLLDAKDEISRIPDRLELEQRTQDAEERAEKMSSTLEVLSSQLTKARAEETAAKTDREASLLEAKKADAEKQKAFESVNSRISEIQTEADAKAESSIAAIKKDSEESIRVAEAKVRDLENQMNEREREAESRLKAAVSTIERERDEAVAVEQSKEKELVRKAELMERDAATKLQETTATFEKQLEAERTSNARKIQEMNERLLANERDAESRLKAAVGVVEKERDNAIAEAQSKAQDYALKIEAAQKAATDNLQETKLSFEKQLIDEREAAKKQAGEMEERMQAGQRDAESKLKAAVSAVEKEKDAAVAEGQAKVQDLMSKLESAQNSASSKLQEVTSSLKKQLMDERAKGSKQVQATEKKYETLLDEAEKKAKARLDAFQRDADQKLVSANKESKGQLDNAMKESKVIQNTLTKERDEARKELEKMEARSQKIAAQTAKDRESLEKQISKLQAKIKNMNDISSKKQTNVTLPASPSTPTLTTPASTSEISADSKETDVGKQNASPKAPGRSTIAEATSVKADKNSALDAASVADNDESQFARLQAKLFSGSVGKKMSEPTNAK